MIKPNDILWEGRLSESEVGFDCHVIASACVRQTPARQLDNVKYYQVKVDPFGNEYHEEMSAKDEADVRERILARLLVERHQGAK